MKTVQLGGDYEHVRATYPSDEHLKCFTFNSSRKMMATVVRRRAAAGATGSVLYAKGASEIILAKCVSYVNAYGVAVTLSDEKRARLVSDVVEQMARAGLRTIGVAYRDLSGDIAGNLDDEQKLFSAMTCVCLVGIEDPVRDEVPEAIKK